MGQVMKFRNYATTTDERISATVLALMSGRRTDAGALAQALEVNKTSVYNKLKGATPWKASEIEQLATIFDVEIVDLFSGLSGRFGPPGGQVLDSGSKGWGFESLRAHNAAQLAVVLPFERPAA